MDTPFSAAKLRHNHAFLRGAIAARPDDRYLRSFTLEIYGVTATAAVERDYWQLLEGIAVPVLVVTGDVPMLPQRKMPPVPCRLDEDDRVRLRKLGCQLERVKGGHAIINDNPAAVGGAGADGGVLNGVNPGWLGRIGRSRRKTVGAEYFAPFSCARRVVLSLV
ncbi:hypothetical protein [Achromobacter marplatensis]|uniref:Uncharacterized protein n=1 Tax=Achromobacter marplatensis TaxID=470868 RepID=A0AA42WGI2_9BURK|nr:hypothetical protein [Achromobacter marplatensis]MDH2053184.1 hypothetical protein [Achromobacter marplatensis]